MERSNNTLTANEFRNDRDTVSANTAFIEGGTTQDERPLPEDRTISRRKLKIFVSIMVGIGIIILVILIPILGLRKNS